jgi:hypothetical protein
MEVLQPYYHASDLLMVGKVRGEIQAIFPGYTAH